MIAHLLFEQSGTFKKAFQKYGIKAYDYDILNDFGETDYVIDLFNEIEGGYDGKMSIFDNMASEDIVLAFFPCVRFEDQFLLSLRGDLYQCKNKSIEEKLESGMRLEKERSYFFEVITKLVLLAMRKGLRLIIENPASSQHYLTRYWSIKPQLIDSDRRVNGDWYKKPTQFWFINCEPLNQVIWEPIEWVKTKTIKRIKGENRAVMRSMIHPQYADRFIRQQILTDIRQVSGNENDESSELLHECGRELRRTKR